MGLLPLLVLDLHGTEIEGPLAIVMVGGLVTSTLFTLLALPAFYALVHQLQERAVARRPVLPDVLHLPDPGRPMGADCCEDNARQPVIRHALRLEYFTIAWNIVEGMIAVAAAFAAGSVALLSFGLDSFVESASGGILIWRFRAESRAGHEADIERLDRRAHRLVGVSLFLLAAYVAVESTRTLVVAERPEPSVVGIVLTAVSIAVMIWLARAKRRAARVLGSRALEADAFQTSACWWLSVLSLSGIGLNAALGWWWADPVAALGMTLLLIQEGREARRGQDCCG